MGIINYTFQKSGIAFILFISSCGGNILTADDGVYFQDFDNLRFWSRVDCNLSNEKAHSGDFSTKTDSVNEFSQAFQMDFSYAKSRGFKAMQASEWLYVFNMDSKAGLVASVEFPDGNTAYKFLYIKNLITITNQWEKVSIYLKLPEDSPDRSKIKVYLWSPGKEKIFIDDVTVKLSR